MTNTFYVGDLEVLALSDGEVTFPAHQYFPASTEEQWKKHERWLAHDGTVTFPYGCFLVRSGDTTVLIDTGVGPVVTGIFRGGQLLANMAAAGVDPADIDHVFLTHLHLDHCGTAAVEKDGAMTITFPNAAYRWTAAEQEYWAAQPPSRMNRKDIFDAVAPRWQPTDTGATIAPGVSVIGLPGHTPGHAGIVLASGAARAFILGDAISCPVQLEEPEWSGLGDLDKNLARATQEALAKEVEGTGALVGASHFPGLTFGRVLRGEGRRYWQPV
jgi:glyoxylase-like metal-dependent hydrolase (beta-lactamase superfamily II)